MTELVSIDFRPEPVLEVFAQIPRRAAGKAALMREIAGIMLDEVEENFEQEGRPRWAQIRSVSLSRAGYTRTRAGRYVFLKRNSKPGYKILQASGRLASSITPSWTADSATVGTNVVYARIQHFGGRTKPHVIKAKNAKALGLPGGPRKSVNHPGSVIPPRPFMVVTESGEAKIVRAGEAFLRSVIEG